MPTVKEILPSDDGSLKDSLKNDHLIDSKVMEQTSLGFNAMSIELLQPEAQTRSKMRWSFPGFSSPHFVLHEFEMFERVSLPFTLLARLSIEREKLVQVNVHELI